MRTSAPISFLEFSKLGFVAMRPPTAEFEAWDAFPAEIRAALGAVVIEWARFENSLASLFAKVLRSPDENAWVVYYNMGSFSGRCDLIRRILDHDKNRSDIAADIEKLLSDSIPVAGTRNDLAHGFWRYFKHPEGGKDVCIVGQFKPRKPSEKSTYKLEPDVKFLTDLANKIASLTERAAALGYKMRKASV